MSVQCPQCLGYRVRRVEHRWFEVPLALVLVQPYACRHCSCRFLRFRWPDLPLRLAPARGMVAR